MSNIRMAKAPGRQRNRPIKDYAGLRFGRLIGVSLVERDAARNNHSWLFRCDCGVERPLRIHSVRTGKTTSCGCAHREGLVARNTTHGLTRSHPRAYRSWKDMRARCGNPNDSDFAAYGGRGITVCERWSDFPAFFADMGDPPDGHTLDRIEVNGDYAPGNCRWATAAVQANNKTTNRVIEIDGERRTLAQWCAHFGVEPSKVRWRLKQGQSGEAAFSRADGRKKKAADDDGHRLSREA